ncbi:hypothetical protein KAFR_0A02930 [Kazachstania africana CBS 2517]|uniref:NADH-cytochrome b5 reductase n=1 Tax=Kazachstania africana (strain ATCC 22294 / BCRC 22015 / CBS 2517 / CECT 1963 / NBRC 1671 / NRRL Y-8276) TaxID=1071382 RepID=H2AMX9_KAZAF|nr:hypothetical protein KAFR_0A02930 [Kazachstania africana CBS 2517]CCF55729.1 hypothetical protein KAFR_0A02930 [Kazachstania africana CBS 2517]
MDQLEDNTHNILDEPLHGIVIPSGLFITGILLMTYMSSDKRILFALPVLFSVVLTRFISAYQRRQSLFKDRWTQLELEDQTLVSKNTAIYRFKLKTKLESLDIPAGHHVAVKMNIDGKDEIRYYNPISSKLAKGYVDLMVKSYPNGKVSKQFASLTTGSLVDFMGPMGQFHYKPNSSKELAIVAGGSGITPILQVLNEIITVPEDVTKVSIIYANVTENDILLKDELDEICFKYPNVRIHYVLDKPKYAEAWRGDVGFVTKEQMQQYLPLPNPDNRLLICGPEQMESLVLKYAEELGWNCPVTNRSNADDQVFVFN